MKAIIAACVLAVVATALARPNEELYTDKYDNLNLDEILSNERLKKPYVECLLVDGAKCAPEAKELKSHIREALENNCAKCSDKHKEGIRKVIQHLIKHDKEIWMRLKAKYDPENKYTKKYEDELEKIKA